MIRAQRMIDRLPVLYRPEADDPADLIAAILNAGGSRLDAMHARSAEIMQAHWWRDADHAKQHPYVMALRQIKQLPPLRPKQRIDIKDLTSLLDRLNEDTNLTTFLRDQLTEDDRTALQGTGQGKKIALAPTLVSLFEAQIDGPLLLDENRFDGLTISPELQARAALPGLRGTLLAEVNLDLLLEAFPDTLAPARNDHEYLRDLAKVAAVIPLKPWHVPEPAESVETFRLRIQRMMAIYRNGLGTEAAIRAMTTAMLPVDIAEPAAERDLPFTVEINPRLPLPAEAIQVRGPEAGLTDRLGPLMRWDLTNLGKNPIAPTVTLVPLDGSQGEVDPADNPLIERMSNATSPAVGLAFSGTLAPGSALQWQPRLSSWLARDVGLRSYTADPAESPAAIPSSFNQWVAPSGFGGETVHHLHQSKDHALWAAFNDGNSGSLWRFDGQSWQSTLENLPEILCLDDDGYRLIIGTADGLRTVDLYPEANFEAVEVGGTSGTPVHALLCERHIWWLGTGNGLKRMEEGGNATDFGPTADHGLAVLAVTRDESGFLYAASERALFQYQPWNQSWSWLAAAGMAEHVDDWQPFTGELPATEAVFLPIIRAVHRDRFGHLWLGTDEGLARFRARSVGGAAYETIVEAFPDLVTTPVTRIRPAPDGSLWFCTGNGLLTFDGRDFWQPRQKEWAQLGRADHIYTPHSEPRGAWRFQPGGQWQRRGLAGWQDASLTSRTSSRSTLHDVVWTDGVNGNLGSWQNDAFQPGTDIETSLMRMRIKPQPDRVVDGGIPALPTLTPGTSTWRYLRLTLTDQAPVPPERGRPVWNAEGRLFPPPEDATAPWPGRYGLTDPPPESLFDQAVFAYLPAVRCHMAWDRKQALTVLVRLGGPDRTPTLDPAVIDRVWQGLQHVKPAGIRLLLAAGPTILRGM